jgi:hypothetical protein
VVKFRFAFHIKTALAGHDLANWSSGVCHALEASLNVWYRRVLKAMTPEQRAQHEVSQSEDAQAW